ncbi:anhydro-N-acetylmuramic acid kinase [Polaromonas sp. A23]|uniref:anhydro-N-acetylmuramic acid kinase n=1 Tax=Polaromonas sp. A23 TaxID=1944133 RepID=UPI000986AB46|nr:anhydro-N-acetylmuramic acid kinase [Polaromonas sp. A23]OOG43973.1 anhydro-N-acetylmuramic acid kinase [Polaromonas sp. A23]
MADYYMGLMSGTSLDGADGVLVAFENGAARVIASASADFPSAFRDELLALNTAGANELHRAALAANQLAGIYARVVHALLAQASSQGIKPGEIRAVGAHGQTVRHRPQEFGDDSLSGGVSAGYTLQLNNPALLAELTGLAVVADFRTADLAAGGQGAPLVPAFHHAFFARPKRHIAVLNIGGISNLTLLSGSNKTNIQGFDCGPGNALMDFWCARHTGAGYDAGGSWAASGTPIPGLLSKLLDAPYFAKAPPKSTGRDLFNPAWLATQLQGFEQSAPQDVQATLTALTAQACARDLLRHAPGTEELLVCGGGALNDELMRQLALALPGVPVKSTAAHGLPPLQVEAAAFAWLAHAWHQRQPGNLVEVTGARGPRVLGALYLAPTVAHCV